MSNIFGLFFYLNYTSELYTWLLLNELVVVNSRDIYRLNAKLSFWARPGEILVEISKLVRKFYHTPHEVKFFTENLKYFPHISEKIRIYAALQVKKYNVLYGMQLAVFCK